MRKKLLNWCNLASISKNVMFYAFLVVRIYWIFSKFDDIYYICIYLICSKSSVYLQNISWSNVFGKFVLIVNIKPLSKINSAWSFGNSDPDPSSVYSLCLHWIYISVTFIAKVFFQSYSVLGKKAHTTL